MGNFSFFFFFQIKKTCKNIAANIEVKTLELMNINNFCSTQSKEDRVFSHFLSFIFALMAQQFVILK